MMEIWKDIEDYPGYQVSNYGRVRSHNKITKSARFPERKWKDRIMKLKSPNQKRGARVELWKGETHQSLAVHRLVAIAFLGKPEDAEMTVNHKDGNRLNNNVENLEWLSLADNIRHAFENNLNSNQKNCTLIDEHGESHDFNSLSKAGISIGRSVGYISENLIKGRMITGANGKTYRCILR